MVSFLNVGDSLSMDSQDLCLAISLCFDCKILRFNFSSVSTYGRSGLRERVRVTEKLSNVL